MFVELIEALRCPRDHEESPLVVTASRTEARHILEGILGCPICKTEFPIRSGEALFAPDVTTETTAPSQEMGMRLAAFLDLADPTGFAILSGSWGALAEEVRAISNTPLLLVNPPFGIDVLATGIVRVRGRLPLAPLSARAAALHDDRDDHLLASTVGSVRAGGRIVGPVELPVPEGVRELTRDARMWIAEKGAPVDRRTTPLVTLRRA